MVGESAKKKYRNLARSVVQRQYSNSNSSYYADIPGTWDIGCWDQLIHRSLWISRAPKGDQKIDKKQCYKLDNLCTKKQSQSCDLTNKWSLFELSRHTSGRANVHVVGETVFYSNQAGRRKQHSIFKISPFEIKRDEHLLLDSDWVSMDIWTQGSPSPDYTWEQSSVIFILEIPKSLQDVSNASVIGEQPWLRENPIQPTISGFLTVVNAYSGRLLQKVPLNTGKTKFSTIEVYTDADIIVVNSNKATLASNLAQDWLLFKYPPLKLLGRLQMDSAILKPLDGHDNNKKRSRCLRVEIVDHFLIFVYPSYIHICELRQVLNQNKVLGNIESLKLNESLTNADLIPVTHYVRKMPPILLTIHSKGGQLEFVDSMCTPIFITVHNKNYYEALEYSGEFQNIATHVINSGDVELEDVLSSFSSCHIPRLLYGGNSGYDIWDIERKYDSNGASSSCVLRKIFSTQKFYKMIDKPVSSSPASFSDVSSRESRRRNASTKINYSELECPGGASKVFGFDYHSWLHCVAITALSSTNDELTLSIFEGDKMELLIHHKVLLNAPCLNPDFLFRTTLVFHDHYVMLKATESSKNTNLFIHYNALRGIQE